MTARINTPLRNYFFYKSGVKIKQPLTDGFIFFYENDNRTPEGYLTVYQDAALTIPYTNPLQLDGDGGCPPIYLQDEAYYIAVWSCEDGVNPDQLQFDIENYEGALLEGGGPTPGASSILNFFQDGQFNLGFFNGPTEAAQQLIANSGWQYERDGTAGTDNLSFPPFPVGEVDIPQNPLKALTYVVSVITSGQTVNRFFYPFKYVRTLENIEVTLSFYARSTISTSITPFYEQDFGTGGSPSPTNTVLLNPISLTGTWTLYSQTFTIDPAAGKTLGSNNDDQFKVGINFPLNSLANVSITNMLLEEGSTAHQYPYLTDNLITMNAPLYAAVITTTADVYDGVITPAADSGKEFLSVTYTPKYINSYLLVTFSSGAAANNSPSMLIAFINEDDTTVLCSAQISAGALNDTIFSPLTISTIVSNTSLEPRTFKVRYGAAPSAAEVNILFNPTGGVPDPVLFPVSAILSVQEFKQQT